MAESTETNAPDHRFTWELYADTTATLTRHGYGAAGTVQSYTNTVTLLGWLASAYEGRHFDPSVVNAHEWVAVNRP